MSLSAEPGAQATCHSPRGGQRRCRWPVRGVTFLLSCAGGAAALGPSGPGVGLVPGPGPPWGWALTGIGVAWPVKSEERVRVSYFGTIRTPAAIHAVTHPPYVYPGRCGHQRMWTRRRSHSRLSGGGGGGRTVLRLVTRARGPDAVQSAVASLVRPTHRRRDPRPRTPSTPWRPCPRRSWTHCRPNPGADHTRRASAAAASVIALMKTSG